MTCLTGNIIIRKTEGRVTSSKYNKFIKINSCDFNRVGNTYIYCTFE